MERTAREGTTSSTAAENNDDDQRKQLPVACRIRSGSWPIAPAFATQKLVQSARALHLPNGPNKPLEA